MTTTNTKQEMANVMTAVTKIFSSGDCGNVAQLFRGDYVEHAPVPPGWPAGVPGLVAYVAVMRTAFPNLQQRVVDVIADGDRCCAVVATSGTQDGPLMHLPPTRKSAEWIELHCCRFANGKIVEHWEGFDRLDLLAKLGHGGR